MAPPKRTGTEWDWDTIPQDVLRKANADQARERVQRTRDIRFPRIITLKTAVYTTNVSWNRFDGVKGTSAVTKNFP